MINIDRSKSKLEQIEQVSEQIGIPADLTYRQWTIESSRGQFVDSPAGAQGDFQIMPATRKVWEKRMGKKYNPYDFSDSLELMGLSMRENLKLAKGNLADAYRIYNAGTNRDIWDNEETNNYIKKMFGNNAVDNNDVGVSPDTRKFNELPKYNINIEGKNLSEYKGNKLSDYEDIYNTNPGELQEELRQEKLNFDRFQMQYNYEADKLKNEKEFNDRVMTAYEKSQDKIQGYKSKLIERQDKYKAELEALKNKPRSLTEAEKVKRESIISFETSKLDNEEDRINKRIELSNYLTQNPDKITEVIDAENQYESDRFNALMRDTTSGNITNPEPPEEAPGFFDVLTTNLSQGDTTTARATYSIFRKFNQEVDPDFNSNEFFDKYISEIPPEYYDLILSSKNKNDAELNLSRIKDIQESQVKTAKSNHPLLYNIGSHILDPTDFIVYGVATGGAGYAIKAGKTLRNARIAEEGIDSARLGVNATENLSKTAKIKRTVSNDILEAETLLGTATREAVAGGVGFGAIETAINSMDNTYNDDVFKNILEGAIFGGALGAGGKAVFNKDFLLSNPKQALKNKMKQDAEKLRELNQLNDYHVKAVQSLNKTDATNEEILEKSKELYQKDVDELIEAITRKNEKYQLTPLVSEELDYQINNLENNVLKSREEVDDAIRKYKLKNSNLEEGYAQDRAAEVFARVDKIEKELKAEGFDIQKNRTNSILNQGSFDMRETSLTLLDSDNQMMRVFGILALENGVNAAGKRFNQTSAMTKDMVNSKLVGKSLRQYEQNKKIWMSENGYRTRDTIKDLVDGKLSKKFDEEVFEYRERLNSGNYGSYRNKKDFMNSYNQGIKDAAKVFDDGYNQALKYQKIAKLIGADEIDFTEGYQTRAWNSDILIVDNKQKPGRLLSVGNAIKSEIKENNPDWDSEFVEWFVDKKYLPSIQGKSGGAEATTTNISPENLNRAYRDFMEDKGKSSKNINKLKSKSRRHRIKMDVYKTFSDEHGEFKLSDYLIKDNKTLYRGYMDKVSGEIALNKIGIQGQEGLEEFLSLAKLKDEGVSPNEEEAFRSATSFITGKPFNTHKKNNTIDNVVSYTGSVMLGGVGITQMIEVAAAIPAVGFSGILKSMPYILNDIKNVKNGGYDPMLSFMEDFDIPIGGESYWQKLPGDNISTPDTYMSKEEIGKLTNVIRKGAHANIVLSGMRAIHSAQERGVYRQIMGKALKYIKEDKEFKALADMGIDKNLRKRIKSDLDNFADFEKGKLKRINHTNSLDKEAFIEMHMAFRRGANQIILKSYAGEGHKFVHSSFANALTMFRNYGISSMSKQVGRVFYNQGLPILGYAMLGAMSVTIPVHMARVYTSTIGMTDKEKAKYLEENMSIGAILQASLNYNPYAGLLSDAVNTLNSFTGIGSAFGLRGAYVGGAVGQFSPIVSQTDRIARSIATGNVNGILKSIPGSSNPGSKVLINNLERIVSGEKDSEDIRYVNINDAMDANGTKPNQRDYIRDTAKVFEQAINSIKIDDN